MWEDEEEYSEDSYYSYSGSAEDTPEPVQKETQEIVSVKAVEQNLQDSIEKDKNVVVESAEDKIFEIKKPTPKIQLKISLKNSE